MLIDSQPTIDSIINDIRDAVIQYSHIPDNGIVNFDALASFIRNKIESNNDFSDNIQRLSYQRQDYITCVVIPQLNTIGKNLLCIAMATVCNEITINLITYENCCPLYRVGRRNILDHLRVKRSTESDLINFILKHIDNNFTKLTRYILTNISLVHSITSLVLCAFYGNYDTLLTKLINFHNYIQPAIEIINPTMVINNVVINNLGVLVNAVQQSVFNTIVHIYSNVINLDKLSIYRDEHPRMEYRYETLLVIKNFLLTAGVINENNFSNAIMLNLLNKYHNENFATIQEYENYF